MDDRKRLARAGAEATGALDPIRFEVIRNALVAATEEMALALRRSAYSTNIKTRSDFSCAFFDRDLRVIAQAFTQPVHLGSFVELVPRAVRAYGPDRLRPGDMLVSNDPYGGGVHLNDVTVIAPAFYRGQLFGYLANLAHHNDVGGGAPASIGAFREVFQEGVIIPAVKLVAGGAIVDDVFRLILAQIRSKRETAGDFRAQIAANVTGERRLGELADRLGTDVLVAAIDAVVDYTRRRTRQELTRLPRGTFQAEGYVDNDGYTDQRVRLCAGVTVDGDGVLFDLAGSDPQRRAPVNSTFAQTFSACAYALKCLIDQDVPVNQGFYDLVRVNAPLGTVTNCRPPAPVVGGWETQTRLVDVIFKALAPAMPDRLVAGTKAMMCQVGFGGIAPRTGEYYCFYEALAGGYGGRIRKDGPDAVQTHGQNTENAPIEEIEANYPVRIDRYELVPDSDGPGRQRGGLGLRRDYLFPDHEVTFTILADRDREGPWGLFGGLSGRRAEYVLNPDGEARMLGSKVTVEMHPGEVMSYRTCGGGGYGAPEERDPELVLADVRDGKVTAERARSVYRVVIDQDTWTIDAAATAAVRQKSGNSTTAASYPRSAISR
ncbi:MAG: hydantoinase B/oxoprolinase family protein [Chloroflexi bacterium]|nr:hydantoinase B/oxoprolinase family protein [Chloroflexota bacterium]